MKAYIVEKQDLAHNLQVLREKARGKTIWGVVKGNGYGLGAAKLALTLAEMGISHFAVTDVPEVRALREAGLTESEILMLRCTNEAPEVQELLRLGAICSVGSLEDAAAVEAAAAGLGITARVHVKIDTGMGRYGFLPEDWPDAVSVFRDYPHIQATGVFTHFHRAGNEQETQLQFILFRMVLSQIRKDGYDPGMVHCCNSLALWYSPEEYQCDAVRLGSALLGRVPYASEAGLRRIGWVEATVEELRRLPGGHNVGYGEYRVRGETRVAVVSVGYLHGFSVERGYDLFRPKDCLRNMGRYLKYLLQRRRLTVEVNGRPCNVLGHVGMVNLVADVTQIPCRLGDPVRIQINPLDLKAMDVVFR